MCGTTLCILLDKPYAKVMERLRNIESFFFFMRDNTWNHSLDAELAEQIAYSTQRSLLQLLLRFAFLPFCQLFSFELRRNELGKAAPSCISESQCRLWIIVVERICIIEFDKCTCISHHRGKRVHCLDALSNGILNPVIQRFCAARPNLENVTAA